MSLREGLVKNAFGPSGNKLRKQFIKKNTVVLNQIYGWTSFFSSEVTLSSRIYAILNDQKSLHLCPICNKPIQPNRLSIQPVFCKGSCAAKGGRHAARRTCIEKYGVDNPSKYKDIAKKISDSHLNKTTDDRIESRAKFIKTCLDRYGEEHPSKVEKARELARQNNKNSKIIREKTNLERYGVKNVFSSPIIRKQIETTTKSRYGVENYGSTIESKEKVKKTCIERYGVENVTQSDVIKDKIVRTNLDRYGVENYGSTIESKEKVKKTCIERYGLPFVRNERQIKQTCVDRYGVENASQRDLGPEVLKILSNKAVLQQLLNKYTVSDLADMLSVHITTIYHRAQDYDILDTIISQGELFIRNLLDGASYIPNSRKIIPPYELDIYIPEYNLAIEYNGVYWHTESMGKDKNYHLNKTLLCARKNIQLLHIFSSDDMDIWKYIIQDMLGQSQIIYAIQTEVSFINNDVAEEFCEKNYLQGGINSKYNYGLFYEGVLLSVMTFSKSRFSKADYELLRFCTLKGHRVVGSAGKLLESFRLLHQGNIISYADMRWSNGKLYSSLGFKLWDRSRPNYYYTKDYKKLYSKNKLSKLLDKYDSEMTEVENMQNNGWDRIWDCGNLVYILEK